MTPFQEALLALQIAVDAIHTLASDSPTSEMVAREALDQIAHLGFSDKRSEEPRKTWVEKAGRPKAQGRLF